MGVLLLASCASNPTSYFSDSLNTSPLTVFELDGRLAVHSTHESGQFWFHWTHDASHDKVTLYSPLGQVLGVLTRDAEGASLVDSSGKVRHADSVEFLSDKWMGWTFPLTELSYWVVGAPKPGVTFSVEHDRIHPEQLRLSQSGWEVTYLRWHQQGKYHLPDKLSFFDADISAKLVVNHWGLTE
jgi:outer membrane lipoprotein LolB